MNSPFAAGPDAEIGFEYDASGRVIRETQNGRTIASEYDSLGRRIKRTTDSGMQSLWQFDANGLPLALTLPDEQAFAFIHDSLGRQTERHLPGDVRMTQQFDRLGRLTYQKTMQRPDDARQARRLQERGVTYDRNGNPDKLGDLAYGIADGCWKQKCKI